MAEKILEDLRDGAFLVRNSTEPNSEYTYTIAIKYVLHTMCCNSVRYALHFSAMQVDEQVLSSEDL